MAEKLLYAIVIFAIGFLVGGYAPVNTHSLCELVEKQTVIFTSRDKNGIEYCHYQDTALGKVVYKRKVK